MSKKDTPPPEPGTVDDPELGIPGQAEELPFNDAEEDEETVVNDVAEDEFGTTPYWDEEEEDDDGEEA